MLPLKVNASKGHVFAAEDRRRRLAAVESERRRHRPHVGRGRVGFVITLGRGVPSLSNYASVYLMAERGDAHLLFLFYIHHPVRVRQLSVRRRRGHPGEMACMLLCSTSCDGFSAAVGC